MLIGRGQWGVGGAEWGRLRKKKRKRKKKARPCMHCRTGFGWLVWDSQLTNNPVSVQGISPMIHTTVNDREDSTLLDKRYG